MPLKLLLYLLRTALLVAAHNLPAIFIIDPLTRGTEGDILVGGHGLRVLALRLLKTYGARKRLLGKRSITHNSCVVGGNLTLALGQEYRAGHSSFRLLIVVEAKKGVNFYVES